MEKGTSNPRSTYTPGRLPQKTERTSEGRLHEKYLTESLSKLTKVKNTNLTSNEQKVEMHIPHKRHKVHESERTEYNRSAVEESSRRKRRELVKEKCRRHQKSEVRVKTQSTLAHISTASTTNQSSTTTKQTTSKVVKSIISVPKSVVSSSQETSQPSSPQQQKQSLTQTLPHSYKIPKRVQPRPEDGTADKSASKNVSNSAKTPHTVDSMRNSKQETVVQQHSFVSETPNRSSEGQDNRSSLTHQLKTVCNAANEEWYDQVVKMINHLIQKHRLCLYMYSFSEWRIVAFCLSYVYCSVDASG